MVACVSGLQRNMQSKFVHDCPGDELDDDHMSKLIV